MATAGVCELCSLLAIFRFARVCFNVDDFNNRNLLLTAKSVKQGYGYKKKMETLATYSSHRVKMGKIL